MGSRLAEVTVHTDLIGGLGYEGKVTLTLKCNDKVLKSKTYKNKGTVQLFRFLGYCLIGSFEEAKKLIPAKILLLHNNAAYPVDDKSKKAEVTLLSKDYGHWQKIMEKYGGKICISY